MIAPPVSGVTFAVLAVLVPVALCGGFLRGFTGFGGPLFVLPVVALFMPATQAVAVVLCMDLFANVQLLPAARRDSSSFILVPMVIGTLIGLPLGMHMLVSIDPAIMKRVIAGVVLVAACLLLAGLRYQGEVSRGGYGVIGLLSGSVMGATGLGVVMPLLINSGKGHVAQNRANIVVWVFVATVFMLGLLLWRHALQLGDALGLVPLTIAYVAGIALGCRVYDQSSERWVRRGMLICIIAVAIGSLVL
ncbi:MAG TPA: sulfite exporter TauE/SafE family protein [Casimicrobiaceae bacterium]|nr:sulfite exporter TauE/SafE family protein [Casimicrobiaceae bacterium]